MPAQNIILAFSLTLIAGLATGIGSAMAFFTRRTNKEFLSVSLGFSAGVMIYVSLVGIFAEAKNVLINALGQSKGEWAVVGGFFLGILVIAFIDYFVPEYENPHHIQKAREVKEFKEDINHIEDINNNKKLMRMGTFSAIAIAIHNFPEGLATFASALTDPRLGISIAVAIAIHNIPEGISVSIPIFYATGNKMKAFYISFLSGLSEPLGALIGYFILRSIFNDIVFGVMFAAVAGIMVFISIDELLPTSREYGQGHQEIYGFIAGMAVMAISIVLF